MFSNTIILYARFYYIKQGGYKIQNQTQVKTTNS
jgi:hypothetical protein